MTGISKERTEGKRIRKDRAIKKLRGQFEGVRQQMIRDEVNAKRKQLMDKMKS
jgi:hypothetical protein